MMLHLYFDKAGPNDEIPAVTVAGVISTPERWVEFGKKWEEALHEFGELPFFHMSEYESGIGAYEDWNERGVKKERFSRLLDIIEEHVMATVGASVSLADCEASFPDPLMGPAYTLTASHCMNMIPQYRYLHEHLDEEVTYIFEAGDWGYGKLEGIYNDMHNTPWRRDFNRLSGRLRVEDKKSPLCRLPTSSPMRDGNSGHAITAGTVDQLAIRGSDYPSRSLMNGRLSHRCRSRNSWDSVVSDR